MAEKKVIPRRFNFAALAALSFEPLLRLSFFRGATPDLEAPPEDSHLTYLPPSKRIRHSLRMSVWEGCLAEVIGACAGVTAQVGWALHLGCGPLVIGLLGSMLLLAQVAQLPGSWLTSLLGARRVAIVAVALSRQVLLPLVILPFLPLSEEIQRAVFIGVVVVHALFSVIGNNAWVSWMGDLVPVAMRGKYFGARTAITTTAGTAAALAVGVLLDRAGLGAWKTTALAALAGLAYLSGIATTYLMSRQHDPGVPTQRPALNATFQPLWDPGARRVVIFQIAWNFAVGIAAPYYILFMFQELKMGFLLVALHAAGASISRVIPAALWGRALDRVGARPVLIFCSFAIVTLPLLWLLPSEQWLWPLALDAILGGILWGGHNLAAFHLPLSVSPRNGRPFYLAAFAAAGGLSHVFGAVLGGIAIERLPSHFTLGSYPVHSIQLLFIASACVRIFAAMLSLRIIEPGSRSVEELLKLVRSGVSELRILGR